MDLKSEILILFGKLSVDLEGKALDYHNFEFYFPCVDIVSKGSKVKIWVELPGVQEKDLLVFMQRGKFSLLGIKKVQHFGSEKRFFMLERQEGVFYRDFCLTGSVCLSSIQITLTDGVLFISWDYV